MMWLLSGESKAPEDDTGIEKHNTNALYSNVKSTMYDIQTANHDTQLDAAPNNIRIAKRWRIHRWLQSKLAYGKLLVQILKENAHHVDREWTEDVQAKLQTLVERCTSCGASGAWRVHRWWLPCSSLVLGVNVDQVHVSGQWYDELPLNTWVDCPMFWSLREILLPMLINKSAEYPEPGEDEASIEALLHRSESIKNDLPCTPLPQKSVLFCPLPGEFRHLKWWLTKYLADHQDVFNMFAEMANHERPEMQIKFPDSPNPSVFVTTPKVSGPGLNLTVANHAVITRKFWVLNQQLEAFARVVRLGQNRVSQTLLLNTGPKGYNNRVSDLHQPSGVAQMRVLNGLMNQQTIMIIMVFRIVECHQNTMKHITERADFTPSDGEDEWSRSG